MRGQSPHPGRAVPRDLCFRPVDRADVDDVGQGGNTCLRGVGQVASETPRKNVTSTYKDDNNGSKVWLLCRMQITAEPSSKLLTGQAGHPPASEGGGPSAWQQVSPAVSL